MYDDLKAKKTFVVYSLYKNRQRFKGDSWHRNTALAHRCSSITEVKQRRARSIIGWVTALGYQSLYTLEHAYSDVVSLGSENHVNQKAD